MTQLSSLRPATSISDSQHKGNSDKKGKGAGGDDDDSSAGHNTIAGDVLALFSALMYACYLVFLRKATGSKVRLISAKS